MPGGDWQKVREIFHSALRRPPNERGWAKSIWQRIQNLNRKVALKLLAQHITEDKTSVSRFREEAFATSALNHPNIVTIHEIGRWQDRDFIATELLME